MTLIWSSLGWIDNLTLTNLDLSDLTLRTPPASLSPRATWGRLAQNLATAAAAPHLRARAVAGGRRRSCGRRRRRGDSSCSPGSLGGGAQRERRFAGALATSSWLGSCELLRWPGATCGGGAGRVVAGRRAGQGFWVAESSQVASPATRCIVAKSRCIVARVAWLVASRPDFGKTTRRLYSDSKATIQRLKNHDNWAAHSS